MDRESSDIVVLGAGYTGMVSALGIASRAGRRVRVTLVNPRDRFVERIRMHQLATGQPLTEHRVADLVGGTGIAFVPGWATAIDVGAQTVDVSAAGGRLTLPYDVLIHAIGSSTDTSTVQGASEHALTLNSPDDARRVADRLATAPDGAPVVVCGAGLTGIEAATEIAESHPGVSVTLLSHGEPAAMMGPRARDYLMSALERLGITVRSGVDVAAVRPDGVELADGTIVPAIACLWTAGVRTDPIAARAGIHSDTRGRIITDTTLRSVSHPEVFAVGDAAAVTQGFGVIHGTCQSGMPCAAHAAANVSRLLRGRRLRPFRFGYFHQPVSLGRRDAVIQFTHLDDTPRGLWLRGRAAVAYKEAVTSSPISTFRLGRRMPLPSRVLKPTTGGRRNRISLADAGTAAAFEN